MPERARDRNRGLFVLKSRGTAHSNQIREFRLTNDGIQLEEVYTGPEGVLTGSMRLAQDAREREAEQTRSQEFEHRRRMAQRKKKELEARIEELRAELEETEHSAHDLSALESARVQRTADQRGAMAKSRKSDENGTNGKKGARR